MEKRAILGGNKRGRGKEEKFMKEEEGKKGR